MMPTMRSLLRLRPRTAAILGGRTSSTSTGHPSTLSSVQICSASATYGYHPTLYRTTLNENPIFSTRRYYSTKNTSGSEGNHDESSSDDVQELNDPLITPDDLQLAIKAAREEDTNIPGAQSEGKKLAILFTCTVCNTRSAKQFSEQAYQNGVVLVRCPGCQSLHLIADRLGMFEDKGADGQGWDIEKAMAEMGQEVTAITNDNVLELTPNQVFGEKLEEAISNSDKPK